MNIGVALALLAGRTGVPDGIHPVHGFQIDRYLGTWHETWHETSRLEKWGPINYRETPHST